MGLLNKLKNVLFEDVEIEVPVEEQPKKLEKTERTIKKERPISVEEPLKMAPRPMKTDFKNDVFEPPIPDNRELFKAEKKFDFPAVDDDEFDDILPKEPETKPKSMGINILDHERPNLKRNVKPEKKVEKNEQKSAYQPHKREDSAPKFKPSPVISPVYGVLDKNYHKEDIIVAKKPEKKAFNVDVVRKKAFGTLQEDIEKTLAKPIDEFYEEKPLPVKKKEVVKNDEKMIEDLLEETAFDTIDVSKDKMLPPKINKTNEKEVEISKKETLGEEQKEDTLESDLFDLIDSMYENREDE